MTRWPCEEWTYDYVLAIGYNVRLWVTAAEFNEPPEKFLAIVEAAVEAGGDERDMALRIAEQGAPLKLAAVQVRYLGGARGYMIYCIPF